MPVCSKVPKIVDWRRPAPLLLLLLPVPVPVPGPVPLLVLVLLLLLLLLLLSTVILKVGLLMIVSELMV